jgi:hypothetical protein
MLNHKEFYGLIESMRKTQNDYFRTRSKAVLQESKRLERLVDLYIESFNSFEKHNP